MIKTTGSGKVKNLPISKTIRLTENQDLAWNPDKIRNFLDSKKESKIYENIIKKFIPIFLEKDLDIDFDDDEFVLVEKLAKELYTEV